VIDVCTNAKIRQARRATARLLSPPKAGSEDCRYSQSAGLARQMRVHEAIGQVWEPKRQVQVFGEIYGAQTPGGNRIQDLTYNAALGLRLAIFDIAVDGAFLPYDEAMEATRRMGLAYAPLLYAGPFVQEDVLALAEGPETVSGTRAHLRQGIVIRLQTPRESEEIGRVVLKFVGASYLTRKGEITEFT
jgi:RNA ligase (TIGR02306 family)